MYKKAGAEEVAALNDVPGTKQRTRGITAVSAVALWYKGLEFAAAEQLAYKCLADGGLPAFARDQIRNLLSMVWTRSAADKAGLRFVPGDVLVSVKGGQVIHGGAPLELIVQKVEGIRSVLFRTIEMLLHRPFRSRGGPPADLQAMFRPWLFQAPPGSYQFAVRMQEPEQLPLWDLDRPKIELVTATFFEVLRATVSEPQSQLPVIVPDIQYRNAFLNLSRTLAPTGKTFDRLEISAASSPAEPVVTLLAETRQELNAALRNLRPANLLAQPEEVLTIRGVLRALHLDQDWLELAPDDPELGHIRIDDAGEALDDVVGPMVNRKVLVSTLRRGSKYLYRDIELDE